MLVDHDPRTSVTLVGCPNFNCNTSIDSVSSSSISINTLMWNSLRHTVLSKADLCKKIFQSFLQLESSFILLIPPLPPSSVALTRLAISLIAPWWSSQLSHPSNIIRSEQQMHAQYLWGLTLINNWASGWWLLISMTQCFVKNVSVWYDRSAFCARCKQIPCLALVSLYTISADVQDHVILWIEIL